MDIYLAGWGREWGATGGWGVGGWGERSYSPSWDRGAAIHA